MTLPPATTAPRRVLLFAATAALALAAVACSKPPGPSGWAAPHPLKVQNGDIVLVPHKSTLFALAQDSTAVRWQLPPESKNNYPASERGRAQLTDTVNALTIPDDQKASVKRTIDNLVLAGDSVTVAKDALKATDASSTDRDSFNTQIDAITNFEKKALSNVQALYGDLGISADSKTVFVPAFKGYIFALDTSTGYTRWIWNTGNELVGGIAVDGETIYYGTKGSKVFAASAATGVPQWTASTNGEVWATPTISADSIYVTSLDGRVYDFDKSSGNKRWTFSGTSSGIGGQATFADGNVYVGAFDNKLYSIKASDGSMNWSFSTGNWIWAAPVVQSGVVYTASLDHKVYAVDVSSGTEKWPHAFDAGAPVRSTPVMAGGGLVVASRNGDVYKLSLDDGQSQGSTIAGTRVDANLTADSSAVVYVSPTSAELSVVDASVSGSLPTTSYGLP